MSFESALIAVASFGVIGEAYNQYKSAQAQTESLDLEAKENQIQTQQKTLSNYDNMEKLLEAQQAHMTTTGVAFSSPSYNAIARNTINIGSKYEKNVELESSIENSNIKLEKQNVRSQLYAQLFGDASSAAFTAAGINSKMPTSSASAGA